MKKTEMTVDKLNLQIMFKIGSLFFIGSLVSLIWGTQYLYGSLFGIAGVIMSVSLTHWYSKRLEKHSGFKTAGLFMGRTLIWATVFLIPILAINFIANGHESGLITFMHPVNLWATLIYFAIPFISPFVSNYLWNKGFDKK